MGSDEDIVTLKDLRDFAKREMEKPLELMVTKEDFAKLEEELREMTKRETFTMGLNLSGFAWGDKIADYALVLFFTFGDHLDVCKEVRITIMPEEWAV